MTADAPSFPGEDQQVARFRADLIKVVERASRRSPDMALTAAVRQMGIVAGALVTVIFEPNCGVIDAVLLEALQVGFIAGVAEGRGKQAN